MSHLPSAEDVTLGRSGPLPAALGQPATGGRSRRRGVTRLLAVAALAIVVLGGALAAGTLPRQRQERDLNAAAETAAAAPPRVTVATARRVAPDAERVLPGNALPLLEASLHARTTGYVKRRLVDIGDRVKEGQLLAVIEAPDIDDQLAQAKANLALSQANLKLARANADLAKITLDRTILAGAAASPQDLDQGRATADSTAAQVESSKASIKVNEATVQRFTDLQGFQKIIAPFAGVITARGIDPGDLIAADSTTRELFHLMRTDILRVFVNVPQVFATGIRVGQEAVVYGRDDPRKQFKGKVTRTADALDSNTRTLLTEVQVPNPDGALRPGMYLQVKFVFNREVFPILVPSAALVTGADGPRVGVLDRQHAVQYRKVELGRDYGAEIAIVSGIYPGETVVVHPGDALPEGTVVEAIALPK